MQDGAPPPARSPSPGPVLVVAALAEEVAHVPAAVEVLVCGVGKARSTAALAHRLSRPPRPALVVNAGTAGAVDGRTRGVVEVTWVTEHDFPHDAIEVLLGQPLERGFVLRPDTPPMPTVSAPTDAVVLASADMFVADAATAAALAAAGVNLVDMEAFGVAAACAAFGVPLRVLKAVSDSADADAGASFLDLLDECARGLAELIERLVPATG